MPVQEQWHQIVMRYLEEAFPTAEFHFRNGAKAATDSSFFEWCWTSLMYVAPSSILAAKLTLASRSGTDVDLVFIELAVNDDPNTSFSSSENLLRSLLQLDSQPAVVYVDTFSLYNTFAGKQQTLLSAQDIQSTLSPFYDVPQISARPALLPAMIRDHSLKKPWFLGDERHGSTRLHRFLGSMVVGYLMEERCRVEELALEAGEGGDWPSRAALGAVPQVRISLPLRALLGLNSQHAGHDAGTLERNGDARDETADLRDGRHRSRSRQRAARLEACRLEVQQYVLLLGSSSYRR